MTDITRARLEKEAVRLSKKYGLKTGALGSEHFQLDVVPTGSLALDYALGTGGWPLGHPVHLWGEPDIGKSSTLGMAAFRNAQAKGLTTGLIAVEPGFDPSWAMKHGVDPEMLVIARPNNGQEAFDILYDWITDDLVDFIIFDSIGGVVNPKEDQDEGKTQVGGASNLITMGVRRILMPTWKRNKGLIFLNHVREDMKARFGGVKPPGGKLLTHACDIWIHLRASSGSDSLKKIKIEGEDVIVGRNLTAHITRNKLCEGIGVKAKFWYYNMTTDDYGAVGMDMISDIVATAKRTGVIKRSGGWYKHDGFPDGKLQGEEAVEKFLAAHPSAVQQIRDGVLTIMMDKGLRHNLGGPNLEAFDAEAAA